MSNYPKNKEQDVKIELSPNQLSPRDCLPTDFKIELPHPLPAHGQSGLSQAEQAALLREGDFGNPMQPIPVPNKSIAKKR